MIWCSRMIWHGSCEVCCIARMFGSSHFHSFGLRLARECQNLKGETEKPPLALFLSRDQGLNAVNDELHGKGGEDDAQQTRNHRATRYTQDG